MSISFQAETYIDYTAADIRPDVQICCNIINYKVCKVLIISCQYVANRNTSWQSYVTINCSMPSLTWHSEVSATTHTISSQKWSSSIARLFLSRLIIHRPPLRFLASSHIGWIPSCRVTTQTLNICSWAQLLGAVHVRKMKFSTAETLQGNNWSLWSHSI